MTNDHHAFYHASTEGATLASRWGPVADLNAALDALALHARWECQDRGDCIDTAAIVDIEQALALPQRTHGDS